MQNKESFSDEELAILTQQGGMADFEELAKRYWPRLHRFLLTYGNDAFASDITQETLLRAYHKISYYHSKKSFAPWVFTIARNLALNSLKRSKRKAEVAMDENFTESNPEIGNDHEIGMVWNKAKQFLSKTAYGSGLRIPLLMDVSGINLGYEFFLPIYTEYGFLAPKNYLKTLRFNISFNFNSLNFN